MLRIFIRPSRVLVLWWHETVKHWTNHNLFTWPISWSCSKLRSCARCLALLKD